MVCQLKSESAPVSSNTHGYNHFNGSWLSTFKLPDGSCFKVATQFMFLFIFRLVEYFFPLNAKSYVSVLCASSHLSVTLHYDLSSLVFSIYNIFAFPFPISYLTFLHAPLFFSHLTLPHCLFVAMFSLGLYCLHLLCAFCCSSLTAKGFPALYLQFICLHRDTARL